MAFLVDVAPSIMADLVNITPSIRAIFWCNVSHNGPPLWHKTSWSKVGEKSICLSGPKDFQDYAALLCWPVSPWATWLARRTTLLTWRMVIIKVAQGLSFMRKSWSGGSEEQDCRSTERLMIGGVLLGWLASFQPTRRFLGSQEPLYSGKGQGRHSEWVLKKENTSLTVGGVEWYMLKQVSDICPSLAGDGLRLPRSLWPWGWTSGSSSRCMDFGVGCDWVWISAVPLPSCEYEQST